MRVLGNKKPPQWAVDGRAMKDDLRERLHQLMQAWALEAKRRLESGKLETDPMGRRLIEHGGVVYFNCLNELGELLHGAGNGLSGLRLENVSQDAEAP